MTMRSVLDAAQFGDEVAALEAMRDVLADAMDEAPVSVVAQVSSQLVVVLKRLGELRPAGKVTLDDALAERRALRANETVAAGGTRRKAKSAS